MIEVEYGQLGFCFQMILEDQRMKRIVKIIMIGFCLGVLLLFIKIVFQIPNSVFWQYYLIFSGIVLVGLPAFNVFYNRHYLKQMNAAVQLYKAGHTEEYIAEVESLRRRAKGRFANNMLTINLSAGYCKLKQYGKAAELLESLSHVKLSGEYQLVHRINLCLCYFYQKQTDRAVTLYESSQSVFSRYRNSRLHGGSIAVLDIFAATGIKDYVRAAELLQAARSTWDDARFAEDFCYLEEIIHQPQAE